MVYTTAYLKEVKHVSNRRMLITENRINEGWLSILTGYVLSAGVLGHQAGGFYPFRDFI